MLVWDGAVIFRCRRCEERTHDPVGHLAVHGLPQTMAQVWEAMAPVGGRREPVKREKEWVCEEQDTLW